MSGSVDGVENLKNMLKLTDQLIHDLKRVYTRAASRGDYAELMNIDSSLDRARKMRAIIVKYAMSDDTEKRAQEEGGKEAGKGGNGSGAAKLSLGLSGDGRKERVGEELLTRLKMSATPYQIKKAQKLYDCAMSEIREGNLKAAKIDIKLAIQYDPSNSEYKEQLNRIERLEH